MYRCLLLLAIIALADSHWCQNQAEKPWKRKPHKPYWKHRPDKEGTSTRDEFEDIANKLIDVDNELSKHCNGNNENRTRELFGSDRYFLKYDLPGLVNFNVSIVHRVLQVTGVHKENGALFKDIRILPDILNYKDAEWAYEAKTLKIVIPYRLSLGGEHIKECTPAINKEIIHVDKMKSDDVELRQLNESTEEEEDPFAKYL